MIEYILLGLIVILVGVLIKVIADKATRNKQFVVELEEARKDAIQRSRSSLEGKVFEQLVPHFPEWKHVPSDARFIGTPIDYIVFDGLSEGEPKQITIVEVKKGKGSTTKIQNKIKKLIKEGKIVWELLKLE
jgi:predicted Holliday junction resolvase-like endonuclease